MKTLAAVLLACFSLCCYSAQVPQAEGFYLAAKGPPAPEVHGQDGKVWFLGAKKDLQARVVWFGSTTNDNSSFSLGVSVPNDPAVTPSEYVLVVAGMAWRSPGWGTYPKDNLVQLGFEIVGEANARELSRYFNVPIAYRQHPGHRFRVSIVPSRASFRRGEEVMVTINITNVGDAPVTILQNGRDQRGGKNDFFFSAYRDGKALPEISDRVLCADCLSSMPVIKPGDTFRDTVNLGRWFSFSESGTYEVHGSYHLSFPDAERFVLQGWSEYVGADFSIRIE